MFNKEQLSILNSTLNSNRVKTRNKGNINLSYLEGFDIIDTANQIFGYGNWDYSITRLEQVSSETNQNNNTIIGHKAIVQVLVHNLEHTQSVTREDVGFGTGIAKSLADAQENSSKEAVTDALKRCLRSFGNSLYNRSKNQVSNNTADQTYQANNQVSYQTQQTNHSNTPYQYQQDFNQLINLGLQVVQQGDNLVVVGDGVFANKETIKANGFRWDSTSKTWYLPIRQVA